MPLARRLAASHDPGFRTAIAGLAAIAAQRLGHAQSRPRARPAPDRDGPADPTTTNQQEATVER